MRSPPHAPLILLTLLGGCTVGRSVLAPDGTDAGAIVDVPSDRGSDARVDTGSPTDVMDAADVADVTDAADVADGDTGPATTCDLGFVACGADCVNLTSSTGNCGACGNACPAGQVCRTGVCGTACASGNTLCGTECVTLGDDNSHCGACNNACAAGESCQSGVCVAPAMVSTIGCADGTREGFTDQARFPNIAACAGAWSLPGIFPAIPASPQASCATSGNSSTTAPADGMGCSASNLCGVGWHICNGGEVRARTGGVTGGCAAATDLPPDSFFSAAVSGPGCFQCALRSFTLTGPGCLAISCSAPPTNCQESGDLNNDVFGCGTIGRTVVGECDGLDRTGGNNCADVAGTTWRCGGETMESRTVTKVGAANGGVLCCR